MITSIDVELLPTLIGHRLGPTKPVEISQKMIDGFGRITLDQQWIHMDPEKAKGSQFGTTIAHGFLSLSLLSHVMEELLFVANTKMAINYGLNKVRFPSALASGSQLRGSVEILKVSTGAQFVDMACSVSFTADGNDIPCCVAESLTRFMLSDPIKEVDAVN